MKNLNPRSLSNRQLLAEGKAYDRVMRIFGRYYCDPRKSTPAGIKRVMDRMTSKEIECIGAANNMVMGLNGLFHGNSDRVIQL